MTGEAILLTDWTWITLDSWLRRRPLAETRALPGSPLGMQTPNCMADAGRSASLVVWLFTRRWQAERARRSYRRGSWKVMDVVSVTR